MGCKPIMRVKTSSLKYGRKYGVTMKEAKRAFLSGMSKGFKRKVKVRFTREARD